MKEIINAPEDFVDEVVDAILLAHAGRLRAVDEERHAIVCADAPSPGYAGITTGGCVTGAASPGWCSRSSVRAPGRGDSLHDVAVAARSAVAAMRTAGVGLSPTILPEAGLPTFTIGDDEMEIGIGIHREPGVPCHATAYVALAAVIDSITARGGVVLGDKTVPDAMASSLDALSGAAEASSSEAAEAMAAAADAGVAANTANVSRRWRAAWLEERSAGHSDPEAGVRAAPARPSRFPARRRVRAGAGR